MTGTVDIDRDQRTGAAPQPGAPAETPARAPAERAAPRQTRRARRERRPREREHTPAEAIEIRIDEDDPLLPFLAQAPGPLEIAALPAFSPAVGRMRSQGVQLVVPLVTSGELVGVVALGPRRSERSYSSSDKRLLDSLVRYAAPALRVGQLMREQQREARERERIDQELRVAQLIQQQFLPERLPELHGWHVAACYRPARQVGGDFYDVIDLGDGRVMVVTGDVTDKGVPAALVMASTHSLLRAAAGAAVSPGEVLRRVNELLVRQIPTGMFVTCLVLVIDLATGRTAFANAGHNLPYVHRGGGVEELSARGMPLGLMPGSAYDEHETVLEEGDVVLLYSDGITEQHDAAGEMFGFGRTAALVAGADTGDALVDGAIDALEAFSLDVEQEDDITLLALHRGAASTAETVAFEVPSERGNERQVMDRVAEIVDGALPAARLDALRTAVSEAAMNAIEHGNRGDASLEVAVEVRRTAEAVVVEIADYGRGPQQAPETPDLARKLAGLQKPRGWGLFLIEQLVDRVDERTDADRHIVRLTVRTASAQGGTP